MIFRTHLALGFLIGLLSLSFLDIANPVIFIVLITIFSSLPDIDHPRSKIGRKFFFFSAPISLIFKHRGFFHSIFPPIILFSIFTYFKISFLAFAIAIGYIAHLIGDAMTKEGINFLHPLSTLRIQGPLTTGGKLEVIIFVALMIADIAFVLLLMN